MNDLRNKIIFLSNKRCSQDEYILKKRRLEHNRALKELLEINQIMYAQEGHFAPVVSELLQHPSEKVRLSIAAYCLRAGILDEKAREVLRDIEQNSCDRMLSLDAALTAMGTVPCLGASSVSKESNMNRP